MATNGITGGISRISRPGTTFRGPLSMRIYNPAPGLTGAGGFAPKEFVDAQGNQTSVLLTAAQVKALKATPIQLRPARTDGRIWLPTKVIYSLQFGTTAFASGGNVDITFGSGGQALGMIAAASVVNSTASTYRIVPLVALTALTPTILAQGLFVANVGAGEFTTGDGQLLVHIQYDLADV